MPRAHDEFGGFHDGFHSIRPVRNVPVGVGLLGRPTAIGYVCTVLPPSTTRSRRSDRSTLSSIPGPWPKKSRTSYLNSTAAAIGIATRNSASCR